MPPPFNPTYPSIYARTPVAQTSKNTGPFFGAQRASWRSPEDILTILMLIGGDIVQRAVAQLAGAGPGPFTPVAFSFGWLAYAVCALTSAVGDGRLIPQPDCALKVVNVKSGYERDNQSWVLGRLLRDHEHMKVDGAGLTVAFYRVKTSGKPEKDWVYWCGVATILAQMGISLIPGLLHGNWLVLVVTAGGTLLALTGSGLKQWRDEKFAARPVGNDKRDVICLTRGNGARFAMVVISDKVGIRLEDLASGKEKNSLLTSLATAVLSVLWVVLLLTVEGLDGDAWYMLAIGGLGMVQNVLAAGVRRNAAALGFRFWQGDKEDVVGAMKVMDTLKAAEEKEPGVGIALLEIFFPGGLRENEEQVWREMKSSRKEREEWAKRRREEDSVEARQREMEKVMSEGLVTTFFGG